jgi:DNA topoisomerase-1
VGSRYVRCENYAAKEHEVSYPLPQSGEIEAIGEVCEACGAPKIVVNTKKGPWKICIDPACPAKPPRPERFARGGARGAAKKTAASGGTGKRSTKSK